jgi:hypothetical protein
MRGYETLPAPMNLLRAFDLRCSSNAWATSSAIGSFALVAADLNC